MEVICCFAGGHGHAQPMVPVARALVDAGHQVTFAGDVRYLDRLAADGFATAVVDRTAGVPDARQALVAPDLAHEEEVIRRHFVGRVARGRAPAYRELLTTRRPGLVLVDEADFGAGMVADELGLPWATVLTGAAGRLIRPEVVDAALAELRRSLGLPADPTGARRYGDAVLSPFPPSLRDPASPLPPETLSFRTETPATAARPTWWSGLGDQPLVYLTLGSIFPLESGDLFERVLRGLATVPATIAVTVGPDLDPAALGAQPATVHVERWLPQAATVDRASLVVSHGGSGTVTDAVRAGVPQLVLALGADQLHNADRVVALGLGRALDPVTTTPAEVLAAATAVLSDPHYRHRAADLRNEYARLPTPDAVIVPLISRVVSREVGYGRRHD